MLGDKGQGGTPTPEAIAAVAREEALEGARAKLRGRIRELDAALQASSNIGTRYDIKLRIEELASALKLI